MSRCSIIRLTAAAALAAIALVPVGPAPAEAATVLDHRTDVVVTIAAPDRVSIGGTFRALLTVSNLGGRTARGLACSVGTPRLDAVTRFRVGVATRPVIELVEGSESRVFRVASLGSGKTKSFQLIGNLVDRPIVHGFTLSAACTPSPVDAHQGNNAAVATVSFVEP